MTDTTEFSRVPDMPGYYISSNTPYSGEFVPVATHDKLKRQRDLLLEAMKAFAPAIDRVLWIALNWNDHNFDHEVIRKKAREAARALCIPDSDCSMNPSKERERLFNMWNEAISAAEGE